MGEGLHKFFKDFLNELNDPLTNLVESGSEVSHFIPELSNCAEVARLSADVKKSWL